MPTFHATEISFLLPARPETRLHDVLRRKLARRCVAAFYGGRILRDTESAMRRGARGEVEPCVVLMFDVVRTSGPETLFDCFVAWSLSGML